VQTYHDIHLSHNYTFFKIRDEKNLNETTTTTTTTTTRKTLADKKSIFVAYPIQLIHLSSLPLRKRNAMKMSLPSSRRCCLLIKCSQTHLSSLIWGQFHQQIYPQLLCLQIPKAQKYSNVVSVILAFWDLHEQKLLVKCW